MSGLFRLDWKDLIKGAVVSILSAVLTLVLDLLKAGGELDWRTIGTVAITAFISYLLKNLVTDDRGKLGGKF